MTLEAMNYIARYLAGVPGRKNLIWFSGSFPISVFPDGKDKQQTDAMRQYGPAVRKTADLLTLSKVAVYPVGAEGVINEHAMESSNFASTFEDSTKSRVAGKTSFASHVSDGVHPVTPYMSCWQACINSKSAHKKAAFLILLWATSKPTSLLTSAAGLATTRTSAWSSDAFKTAFNPQAAQAALSSLSTSDIELSKDVLFHPQAPQIFDAFAIATNEIVTGGVSAKDALTRGAKTANAAIRP